MISTTDEIDRLVNADSPVAIGVSGGKDSCALALSLSEHLDQVNHKGQRILIHSDLGRVEWKDSGPTCERLAKKTGLELVTVRRNAGDMLARWQGRWQNNVTRYADLSSVQLILPWSTPAMRFCTSELKTDVICSDLVKRFPRQAILSASGIRREESAARAKSPIAKSQPKLTSKKHATTGFNWNPIADWSLDDVLAFCWTRGFRMHEAYRAYGASRVSCCFCIMSTHADLLAASGCDDNHDIYREMVALEAASTFGFQGGRWLADVAPQLLSRDLAHAVQRSKEAAIKRREVESTIPRHLLYTSGWPTCIPTPSEAGLLASVRQAVSVLAGIEARCLDSKSIIGRYEQLTAEKLARSN